MGPENHYPHNDTINGQTASTNAYLSDVDGRHHNENERTLSHRTSEGDAEECAEDQSEETCGQGRDAQETDVDADTHFVVPCFPYCFK